jgi:hypothetical protein
MTTPRDLMIIAIDEAPRRSVEPGDLSLALAGAELIDLLALRAVSLEDGRLVAGDPHQLDDRLLDEAASSLVREPPYESVGDWLWRRGRGLSSVYVAALEADGQLAREHRHRISFRTAGTALADSPDHRRAADRWTSKEPVLTALARAVGIDDRHHSGPPAVPDEAVATVLALVDDALTELAAARQRREIEQAAFDNIWRGE